MQNKFKFGFMVLMASLVFPLGAIAATGEEVFVEDDVIVEEDVSADAVAAYNVDGSLFQQITDLEQEKVLMQLEKERAQLDLDLDRLAAEKIKLHMEIDTLSGRAEQQQQELDAAIAELEAQTAKFEREKENFAAQAAAAVSKPVSSNRAVAPATQAEVNISDNYKLLNVFGAGNQLQATVSDLITGQNKRISVGKKLDGYTVRAISVDDGIEFVGPDGDIQNLNISND